MLEALIGAASGVLTIALARMLRRQRWFYAIGLIVLPSLYAGFALRAGLPALGLREMAWGLPFLVAGLVFAFVDVRQSAAMVGAFWILHGAWDLTHDMWFTNPGVPGWYPVWCGAVDAVVGAYLLALSRRIPEGNLRRA